MRNLIIFITTLILLSCSKGFEDYLPQDVFHDMSLRINGELKHFDARAKRERNERKISLLISVSEYYLADDLEIFVEKYTDVDNYMYLPDSMTFRDTQVVFLYTMHEGLDEAIEYRSTDGELLVIKDNSTNITGEFYFKAVPSSAIGNTVETDTIEVIDGYFNITYEEGY